MKDQRMDFIRSTNYFKGLEQDYGNAKIIQSKKRKINYPLKAPSIQLSLFEQGIKINYPKYGIRSRSGHFYELLSQAIWGGKVKELYSIEQENGNCLINTEPDVSNLREFLFREVKSFDSKGIVKLNDDQIYKYFLLQTQYKKQNLGKSPKIIFDLYRYGFSGIQSKYSMKDLGELIKDLSASTKYMISLPYSLIFQIYKDNNNFSSRYEGDAAKHYTRFLSRGINNLLAYPEETILDLGGNLEDYIIEKRRSQKNIFINGFLIERFPVLVIKDNLCQEEIKLKLEEEVKRNKAICKRFENIGKQFVKEKDSSGEIIFENQDSEVPQPLDSVPF